MTRRQLLVGSGILLAFAVLYPLARLVLHPDSTSFLTVAIIVSVVEGAVLVLCGAAFLWSKGKPDRWIWAWVGLWVFFGVFGDTVWAYYQVVLEVEVPSPGLAGVGYLAGYLVAFAGVLVAAWKALGPLRSLETTLDATMITIGAAGLAWPLLLSPLMEASGGGLDQWVILAYPIGDLSIILALFALFFAMAGSTRMRPRPYFLLICLAFICQIVADSGYFVVSALDLDYRLGSWLDGVWLLSRAIVGIAALMGMRAAREPSPARAAEAPASAIVPLRRGFESSYWRVLAPYLALPIIAGMLVMQYLEHGWRWDGATQALVYLGLALVILLVCRQYVTIAHNRRLNARLMRTSDELKERVGDLADLNERLHIVNRRAQHLNSLRTLSEVADAGLELACSFERFPGGWISLRGSDEEESVVAVRGEIDEGRLRDTPRVAWEVEFGPVRTVTLEVREESLGTMNLLSPVGNGPGPELLPVIAAHVATAIDNAKRYQDALNLAERDALTGLFNHRGIHKRLAGEALRAKQNGTELSLIMMDIDDFKLLNDTFGHPVGDSVLRRVSEAIRSVLRHADLAGRVGGDELLLVLPNTGAEGAALVGERIRHTLLAQPYKTDGDGAVPVHVSLGVATYPTDTQSLGQLLETADANLYASKQRGGNTTTGSPVESKAETEAGGVMGVAGRLLDVVGARDHYTRRHSENVVLYALALGEAIGLPEESMSTLHVAAMLHDVGKIAVPGAVLRKPSPLSAAEEDMVRRHVNMSAAVIKDLPRLAQVAEAVQSHHERHDGTGYPTESAGDDIPLLGRILAVADSYSAMTLGRPYRQKLTHQQAKIELQRVAGTQLDPELVGKFIEVLDTRDILEAEATIEAV